MLQVVFLLPLCGVALLAGLQARSAGPRLNDPGRRLVAWLTYPAFAAALAVGLFLHHRPMVILLAVGAYVGLLAMSLTFLATSAITLRAPRLRTTPIAASPASGAPATPPGRFRARDLAYAWPTWLAATAAMVIATVIVDADEGTASEFPLLFCALPLLAAGLALAGRAVGARSRAIVSWLAALGGVGMFVAELSLNNGAAASRPFMFVYAVIFALSIVYIPAAAVALIVRLARRPA
ncbi:MAG TPA: hypothetical protein VHW60_13255 [Caulobacteraceae bacterium]|nr:hypothetical protein [Caulobacteraceae bacterium]